ncbi:MAG: outer membrane lipid asymmetry maintenance protein MlaD [Mariprofundales bacterium]
MTEYKKMELVVGAFVFVGLLGIAYMSMKIGEVGGFGASGYHLQARFDDAGGMRAGADVMIAGVVVGRVSAVSLEQNDEAMLHLSIDDGVQITKDAIASVRTKGIIGDRYIRVSQGGDDKYLPADGEIFETESAMNIEDLVGKYIYSDSGS